MFRTKASARKMATTVIFLIMAMFFDLIPVKALTPPEQDFPIKITSVRIDVFDKNGNLSNIFIDDNQGEMFVNSSMGYIQVGSKIKISWEISGESQDFDHYYVRFGIGSDPSVLKDDTIIERNLKTNQTWFTIPKKSMGWYFKIWISAKGKFKKNITPPNNDFADDLGGANTRPFCTRNDLYPPTIIGLPATEITSDSGKLNAYFKPGNAPPDTVHFLLAKDDEKYDQEKRYGTKYQNEAGEISFGANGLDYDTTYHYIPIGANRAGVVSAGGFFPWEKNNVLNEITFRTLPILPEVITYPISEKDIILDNPPSDTTKDGATISGFLKITGYSKDFANPGNKVEFWVRQKNGKISKYPLIDPNTKKDIILYSPTEFSIKIPLDFDEIYSFKAHTINSIGESFGAEYTFSTPKRIVPPEVITMGILQLNPYSALLWGRLISMGNDPNGCDVQFRHNKGIDNIKNRPYGTETGWMHLNELGDFHHVINFLPGPEEPPNIGCDGSIENPIGTGGLYSFYAVGKNSCGEMQDWGRRQQFWVPSLPRAPRFSLKSVSAIKGSSAIVECTVIDFGKDDNYEPSKDDDEFWAQASYWEKNNIDTKKDTKWILIRRNFNVDQIFSFPMEIKPNGIYYEATVRVIDSRNGAYIKPEGQQIIMFQSRTADYDAITNPQIITLPQKEKFRGLIEALANLVNSGGMLIQRDEKGNPILDENGNPKMRPITGRIFFEIYDPPGAAYEKDEDWPPNSPFQNNQWPCFGELNESITSPYEYNFTHNNLPNEKFCKIRAVFINEIGMVGVGMWEVYKTLSP